MKNPDLRRDIADTIHKIYPNLPKRGRVRSFYEALGRAIGSWQMVEIGLYEVFRAISASGRPGAMSAAFFSILTFRPKLLLVDAAMQVGLAGSPLLTEWNKLFTRTKKKSDHRNNLAHQVVYIQDEKRAARRIHISPNMFDAYYSLPPKKGAGQPPPEPYTAPRIRELTKDFSRLASDLQKFAHKIPQP